MTQSVPAPDPIYREEAEISLLGLASVVLRWRKPILVLALIGGVLGLASGLSKPRYYVSTAKFIPQGTEGSSGLAAAASQFGLRVPTGGNANGVWGPAMYVEIIRSRALLKPIAADTFTIAELHRRATIADLLGIEAPTTDRKNDIAVDAIAGMIDPQEDQRLGAVIVTVKTQWPSLSLQLAQRLVQRVNEFNVETRKSQAMVERKFVEVQAADAERVLREAEDALQSFLQRNRDYLGSPQLVFEHDRLQREVVLRQSLYQSWLQSREDARIREVRDTPVITVLEDPRLATVAVARKTIQKALVGAILAAAIGIGIAFTQRAISRAGGEESDDAREFFKLVGEITPRFLRRS